MIHERTMHVKVKVVFGNVFFSLAYLKKLVFLMLFPLRAYLEAYLQ